MSSFIGVMVLTVCVAWWELLGLVEKKQKKEIVVFLTVLLLAASLYGALTLNVKLPNPLLLIKVVFGTFS